MKRENIVWGVLLILLGLGFLAYQWFPERFSGFGWPWILVALGAVFLVMSLLTRTGGTMVPAAILLGLGGIFLYQTRTGNWASWAYLWPIMPGAAGLGLFLGSFIDREMRPARMVGLIMVVAGVVLFAIFGGLFGLTPAILRYWPVVLIIVGAVVFFRAMRPRHE
jgi:hypothetical protein